MMKKFILLFLFVMATFYFFGQSSKLMPISTKMPALDRLMEPPSNNTSTILNGYDDPENAINNEFKQLGACANAYSTAFNGRTYLWADPVLNSVVFTHRMTGGADVEGNSRIAYDLSTDGGVSWQLDIPVFFPTGPDPGTGYPMDAGRFPQGGIVNPAGNTDPDNAYYEYFAPVLNNQNDGWGGCAYGSNVLTKIPPDATQNILESGGDTWRLIPSTHHVTQEGVSWVCDESSKFDGTEYVYTGDLIIDRGIIEGEEIVYTTTLLNFLEVGESFNDFKIAFAPDGQTGYIVAMAENTSNPVDNTNYHPILLKTVDGGVTWGEPVDIQLGGEDGIESIKNYIPDSIITLLDFYADWSGERDELIFNMGFHIDMVVDALGNPYLIGLISLGSDEGNWYPGLGTEWALYSEDGGETWQADPLWDQYWFDGTVGDLPVYNRPQVSIDYKGETIFYSWLDSEAEQAEENDRPNIYLVSYFIEDDVYTEVNNITYFTQAWNKAFFGTQSYYVFKLSENQPIFNVPFQYVEFLEPDDPLSPVQLWYFNQFVGGVDVPEINGLMTNFSVEQNFPNPARKTTEIVFRTDSNLPVRLNVSNILGQNVYRDEKNDGKGSHSFTLNVSEFDPGIYFYTITIGNQTLAKKMLIE